MPLLGHAALLLSFEIEPAAALEHDDWHTHEHLPERLSVAGFLRGSRWVATDVQPRYFVMYEVLQLTTLTSEPYLQRLNNPTPWTSKLMPFYRGMRRGLCNVTGSVGTGLGHVSFLVRFQPSASTAQSLRDWLLREVLARHGSRPGIGSIHLFEEAVSAPMTSEQRIRGTDRSVGWSVLVTGYRREVLSDLSRTELSNAQLEQRGATGVEAGVYRLDYLLSHDEINARVP